MENSVTPPLKWHGGKHYLAKKIVSLFPPRCANPNNPSSEDGGYLHFCEPYFGGGAVLLENDPEGISEVVNDLNLELAHFWFCLADDRVFPDFVRQAEATPFSEDLFNKANSRAENCIARMPTSRAAEFFVRCRQSLAGRMDSFAGITKSRTRRGMNEQVSAWLNAIEGLPAVHERLKRVLILSRPALEVIKSQDGPRTLFYLDPPYVHSTRATTGEYLHEMSREDHGNLLEFLSTIKGRFLLSGYRCELYDWHSDRHGWNRHDFECPNNAAGGKEKRRMTESVWCNF